MSELSSKHDVSRLIGATVSRRDDILVHAPLAESGLLVGNSLVMVSGRVLSGCHDFRTEAACVQSDTKKVDN